MSVELIETIKQQGAGLTPQEKSSLGRYFLEQAELTQPVPPSVDQEAAEQKRLRNMEWMKANGHEFGGQYIALVGGKLISTGRTFREAREAARAAGEGNAFVTYLPKPDEVLEMGGWL